MTYNVFGGTLSLAQSIDLLLTIGSEGIMFSVVRLSVHCAFVNTYFT